ncbi:MAG: hypothetical protein LBT05_01965, partial [Planctomycetaceae bacterium]|nr:hypothetical protein [Planctomycetaceae bacterium]
SSPQTTAQTPQDDGGTLLTWQNLEIRGGQITQISLILQAATNNTTLSSQPLSIELNPQLSTYVGDSANDVSNGYASAPSVAPPVTTPPSPLTPASPYPSDLATSSGLNGTSAGTITETPPSRDPFVFQNAIVVDCRTPARLNTNIPAKFDVTITNRAAAPFDGVVRVKLSEGLVFVEDNQYLRDKDNVNLFLQTREFSLIDAADKKTSVAPGTISETPLNLAARINSGTVRITVEALGYDPRKQSWEIISSQSKNIPVHPASGR